MSSVIIYNSGSTQKPLSVAVTVAAEAIKNGPDVTLLDIEDFTYIHQGLPPAWFARLVGQRVYPDNFRKYLQNLGVKWEKLPRPKKSNQMPQVPERVLEELEDALKSDLFTYLRTDRLDDYPWFSRFTGRQIRKASLPLYNELVSYFIEKARPTVYIPNGRVAHQRLAILAAEAAGCVVKFYEIGRALPQSAYIGNCQIHDREATQEEARELAEQTDQDSQKKVAEEWLVNRMAPGSSINPFSRVWHENTTTSNGATNSNERLNAVIFTSSADEFSSYGSKWATQTWKDQFEAFTSILKVLEQQGVNCTLRVHPNLVNKGRKYIARELSKIRELQIAFPSLRVIGHRDAVNSYDLVKKSDYIFVGRSTLGLEASLLGKSVWTTTPARYDEIADVRRLHDPSDVSDKYIRPWNVDPSGAQAFVAYWVSQDVPFVAGDSEWCDWNLSRPPFTIRLGNLLLPNAPLHSLHLLLHEIKVGLRQAR